MSLRERKEWWGGGGGSGSAECLLPSLLGQESQVPAGAHTPGTFKRDRVKRGRGGLSERRGFAGLPYFKSHWKLLGSEGWGTRVVLGVFGQNCSQLEKPPIPLLSKLLFHPLSPRPLGEGQQRYYPLSSPT